MYDRRNHAKRLLFGGLLLGSFAALWLALAEVAILALGLGGPRPAGAPGAMPLLHGLLVLALGPICGLTLGTLVSLVHIGSVRLAGKRSLEAGWKVRLYVALSLPLVAAAVANGFKGPWISSLPGVTWIALGSGVVMLLGVWGIAKLVVPQADRLVAGHAALPLRIAAPAILLLLSLCFLLADLRVLPRLYSFFHWMGAACALGSAWMGFGALHLAWGRGMRRRTGLWAQPARALVISTAVLGAGLMGHRAVGASYRMRGLLFERTALASKAMILTSRLGVLPSPAPLEAAYSASEPRKRPRQRLPSASRLRGADLVIITVDALRADRLGLAGHRRLVGGAPRSITPNIDRIFGGGLRFRRAYCATPRTSYSLLSLLTGIPLYTLAQLGVESHWPTLAELLGERGGYSSAGFYPEAIFGIDRQRFTRYRNEHLGFKHFQFEDEDLPAKKRTDQVLGYLNRRGLDKGRGGDGPLFLWVHYFDPHEPYVVRKGFEGFGTTPLARYEAEIAYVDEQVGRLVEAIKSRRPRAIFVLTADHGEEFGEHGGANHGSTLFDEQVNVPLLVVGPGLPDQEVWAPVSTTALVPTLLTWLGAPVPHHLGDAPDLIDVLGEGERQAQAVMADLDQLRMLALGSHKLIHDRGRDYFALYDLKKDPGEQRPLDIDAPGEARRLASRLLGLLERRIREMGRLGRIGRTPEVGPLAVALSASDTERRRGAARIALQEALRGALGDTARIALLRAIEKDPDPEVRHRAMAAVALVGDERAAGPAQLEQLVNRWDLPGDLRLAAGLGLARSGHEAALPVLAGLLHRLRSLDQRLAVVRAMGRLPQMRAEGVDSLAEALRDLELTVPALRVLASLSERHRDKDLVGRAVPDIHRVLGRCPEHPGLRLEALSALACHGTHDSLSRLGHWLAEEPEEGIIARALSMLESAAGRMDTWSQVWPFVPLHGPGLEAPGGACLLGRGCRLEAAKVSLVLDGATIGAKGSLWLVVERGAGAAPKVLLDESPLVLEQVELTKLPGDGVAKRCDLSEAFDVFRAPVNGLAGRRIRLTLLDPSGMGVVVRGVALMHDNKGAAVGRGPGDSDVDPSQAPGSDVKSRGAEPRPQGSHLPVDPNGPRVVPGSQR
ncbi:MAG: sulfatase-like hydrolase/transferase [Polyangia bacterium]|jgi:arylsulfatase A-like enzyme|nr:sulfatase-like hydrolase/transferase [Polyangia bacterium]